MKTLLTVMVGSVAVFVLASLLVLQTIQLILESMDGKF